MIGFDTLALTGRHVYHLLFPNLIQSDDHLTKALYLTHSSLLKEGIQIQKLLSLSWYFFFKFIYMKMGFKKIWRNFWIVSTLEYQS